MAGQPNAAEFRTLARTRVSDLVARLEAEGGRARFAEVLDLAAHLGRAIDSFHMEAIRFRMFTLDRKFKSGTIPVSPEAQVILEDIKHALEAAGFQTRSVAP